MFDDLDDYVDYLRDLLDADYVRVVRLYTDSIGQYHVKLYAEFLPGTFKN